jgi:hypothetical protein
MPVRNWFAIFAVITSIIRRVAVTDCVPSFTRTVAQNSQSTCKGGTVQRGNSKWLTVSSTGNSKSFHADRLLSCPLRREKTGTILLLGSMKWECLDFVSVRHRRNFERKQAALGPTMTARGQIIGISIRMLPQTLIMSGLDQLSRFDARI